MKFRKSVSTLTCMPRERGAQPRVPLPREAALEQRERALTAREQHVQALRAELAAEHAAVLRALPQLQAR